MFLSLGAGCTMIPSYQRPPAPIPEAYANRTNRAPTDSAAPAVARGDTIVAWRQVLLDTTLRRLVTTALENNRDLRVAALRVEQSQAQYRITRAALQPQRDLIGGLTRTSRSAGVNEQWSATAGGSAYEVDLFGRLRSDSRQALERYFATAEARRSVQVALVAEVADRYFAWRRARAQRALALETLQAVRDAYTLTKALVDAGSSAELDLRAAEGQVHSAQISVLNAEREAAQVQNALAVLCGTVVALPPQAGEAASDSLSEGGVIADIPAGLPSELVQQRPDILQAEHTLLAANANIGVARAAFFPSIRLTDSRGYSSSQLSTLFSAATGLWTLAPQLVVPLFRGGANRAGLQSAEVAKRIEVANYEKAIQVAFREVSDALVATDNFAAQIVERTALAEAQRQRYSLALLRYRQGEDAYLPVLTAQQDLFAAQQGRIDAQFNHITSRVSLFRALGGGWH